MTLTMPVLLLFTGLAVDSGRAYVVKAQLSKAVDGAALGAARMLNTGDPRGEAGRIFQANFPSDFMGVTSVTSPSDSGFFEVENIQATGQNIVKVRATAVLPSTFMKLGNINEVTISSAGEATRRMVDLSLVLDVSSSLGAAYPAVRDAARSFIDAFDESADRMSIVTYGWGAQVRRQMQSTRGFDKADMKAAIPNGLPGGTTPMAEGIYRGWDELRTVPNNVQSGLRVIVLFTDGSGNAVPGHFDSSGVAKNIFTSDFPKRYPDPGNITTDSPVILGLYHQESGSQSPSYNINVGHWNNTTVHPNMRWMPTHASFLRHRSSGIPSTFPFVSGHLQVDGYSQSSVRSLRNYNTIQGRFPAEVFNIRNAATNLTEIIADAARDDSSGNYRIRIYAIGMGPLVRMNLGTVPETSESVLMRVANDRRSADFDTGHIEGHYYFANSTADIGPAFQQIQNQIIRLSK
jgi:Flp pilus assembly protein TadG